MGWGAITSKPVVILHAQKFIRVNGVFMRTLKLSFKRFSDEADDSKSPVILLHALLGNKKHWRATGKILVTMTGRDVYSVDLRNHGKSPHSKSHTYRDMAEDLQQLMRHRNLTRSFFIGHGIGGRAAMTLALMRPELVHGLIIEDISPCSNCAYLYNHLPKILKAVDDIDFSKVKNTSSKCTVNRYVRKELSSVIRDEAVLKAFLQNVGYNVGFYKNRYSWICNVKAIIANYEHILELPCDMDFPPYEGPTLFIAGGRSKFIPPDDLPNIKEKFPNAELIYIPKAGHNVHVDNLKLFLEKVLQFLNEHDKVV